MVQMLRILILSFILLADVIAVHDSVAAPAAQKAQAKPSAKQKASEAAKAVKAKKSAPTDSSAAKAAESSPSGLTSAFSDKSPKDSPVFIRSDSLDVDSKGRIFTYYDNVEVLRGDMRITADRVIGRYDGANQIEHLQCEDNVVITRGDTLRANSNRAAYDVKKGMIVMTEAPELNDRGNVLTADKVTIDVTNDKSRAEGHVRVKVLKTDGQQ